MHMVGFIDVLERMIPDRGKQDKISTLLDFYTKSEGIFSRDIVIRHRTMKLPTDWWATYGVDPNRKDPALNKLAMKILGFTYFVSGCERNWSTFESIHTKKRNRLEQKKLNNLVFVQYNKKLRERFQSRKEKPGFFDPICLDELDADNEWLVETEDPVFAREDLTWAQVEDAAYGSTPGEGSSTTRRRRTGGSRGASGSRQPIDKIEEIEEGEGDNDDQIEDHPPLDVDEVLVRTDDEEMEEEEVYVEEGDDSNDDDDDDGGDHPPLDVDEVLVRTDDEEMEEEEVYVEEGDDSNDDDDDDGGGGGLGGDVPQWMLDQCIS
ncbi:RNA-directed DNA methylation 4-like isoform X2 [Magnolia sinica]|uniref:RNA-directed DNA methylation 4-like isoform X2 n=1 Tax=Magnolia sinica TaxID=86752 RepID=UPI002658FA3F|nr:RNA-directed DNA methylation 4-like isoform X2 [Magnolia sinica]